MNREGRAGDRNSREARGPRTRTPRAPRQGLARPAERRHPGRPRGVVVLNQFALPRSEGGGTRHVDLFGRLDAWEPLIVAANRNHATRHPFRTILGGAAKGEAQARPRSTRARKLLPGQARREVRAGSCSRA